jgi:predicted nucleotidyltransferase component of viral defense system
VEAGVLRASDLRRIASQQRISVGFLEKDYAISCFLRALYGSRLGDSLVFKGGTTLKKVYFPETWRMSHDLDFTSIGGFDAQAIRSELQPVFEAVAAEYGVSMSLESLHATPGSVMAEIRFRGPLDYPNNLKLDISLDEKLVLEPVWETIRTGYPDVPDFRVKAYPLKEILVEKLRSLMQRSRSRDYFDVWRLLSEKEFDLEEVRVLLIEKCRTRGIDYSPELIFDVGRLGEVRAYWLRGLGDLMKDPPDFDAVITELRDKLRSLMKE